MLLFVALVVRCSSRGPALYTQQRIGLRFGEGQLTKKGQHRTGLVQRKADDVHQERQHHQNLKAVLTTRRDAGNAWLRAAGAGEDAVTDPHRSAVVQPPHRPFTDQLAITAADPRGIDVFEALGLGDVRSR